MKLLSLSSLLIVVAGLAAPLPAMDTLESERAGSFFALNGTKAFHIPDALETKAAERAGYMRELGVYWDRVDLWWHVVEAEPGQWDFSRPDAVFDFFEARDIQWYPILAYGAAWFEQGRTGPNKREEFDDFAEYAARTVDRYKERAHVWSVWNEPNIAGFWSPEPNPEHYFELLKATHDAIDAVAPDVELCAPVLAPLGAWDRPFTERLLQLGGSDYFDIFDYHYYRDTWPEKDLAPELAEIRAVMARHGGVKPVWVTESGITSKNTEAEETYPRQASLVVRNQLVALGEGVERFFYFDLQNWYDDKPESWDSQLGLVEAGGKRKPSFHAYRTMVGEMDHRDVVGRLHPFAEGVEALLVHDPDHDVYTMAVWDPAEETESVSITTAAADIVVVQPYGERDLRPLEVPRAPGQHTRTIDVEIDRHPRYIRRVSGETYLPHAGVRLAPALTIMAPGESARIGLDVHPLLEETGAEIRFLETRSPEGLAWDAEAGMVMLEGALPEGKHDLTATIEVMLPGAEPVVIARRAQVEVVASLRLTLRPHLEDDQLFARVLLQNQSRDQIGGTLTLAQAPVSREGEAVRLARKPIEPLSAGETRVVSLPMDRAALPREVGVVSWTASFADLDSEPFLVYTAPVVDELPEVDGQIDEQWASPERAVRIGHEHQITRNHGEWTPANASGDLWLRFGRDAVYLGARIADNDPLHAGYPPLEMWKSDALELYLGLRGPVTRTSINKDFEYQIGLAPDTSETDGPVVFWFHIDRVLDDAPVAATRTDDGWVLEAIIPLSAIEADEYAFTPGMLLGYDTALDDLDGGDFAPAGNQPGRALMWNGTGMNWINPAGWGMAHLVAE